MKNLKYTVAGTKLTIEVDLAADHGPSKSGKTVIVATSEGNQPLPGFPEIKVGVNIFKALPPKA